MIFLTIRVHFNIDQEEDHYNIRGWNKTKVAEEFRIDTMMHPFDYFTMIDVFVLGLFFSKVSKIFEGNLKESKDTLML